MKRIALTAVRRAVLSALQADPGYTAIVPASHCFPQSVPPSLAFPFGRFGVPFATPRAASFLWHTFAKPRLVDGIMVETAEDHAARAGAAAIAALDRRVLPVPDGAIKLRCVRSQLLRDGDEADAYHHIAEFDVRRAA